MESPKLWMTLLSILLISGGVTSPAQAQSTDNLEFQKLAKDHAAAVRKHNQNWFANNSVGGHRFTLLRTGKEAFDARLALARSAQRSIYMSAFAFKTYGRAWEMAAELCSRSQQGVDVRVLVDSHGSRQGLSLLDWMKSCGVRVIEYGPKRWGVKYLLYSIHEKLFIADGERVITGGFGYGQSAENASRGDRFWHDLDILIEGPEACTTHNYYVGQWQKIMKIAKYFNDPEIVYDEVERDKLFEPCDPKVFGNSRGFMVVTNPRYNKSRPLLSNYQKLIFNSTEKIRIYAPFFVPDKRLVKALISAVKRGVQVQIITNSASSTDDWEFTTAGFFIKAQELIANGVEIYIWNRTNTMHRKAAVFDWDWAYIGSDNQDRRGQEYSSESVFFTDDNQTVVDIMNEFDTDLHLTVPLTQKLLEEELSKFGGFTKWYTNILLIDYL